MKEILDQIGHLGVLPVLVVDDPMDAIPVCGALLDGGLPIVEITFRTAAAADAIAAVQKHLPDVIVGAGTVITTQQVETAKKSGAEFIVSPGFSPRVVRFCQELHLPVIPGCSNPTDFTMAIEHGLSVVKFFPAESIGGLKMLRAISAPFNMLKFIPTGGIDLSNLREYLGFPPVFACGGSWMLKPEVIASRNYDLIADATRRAVDLVKEVRVPPVDLLGEI